MTTYLRYSFEYPGPWVAGGYAAMKKVLYDACEKSWWYNEPDVHGEPFGRLKLTFMVCARDQWWGHRRALDLAVACFRAVGMTEVAVPIPTWERLPPHTNRGHRLLR